MPTLTERKCKITCKRISFVQSLKKKKAGFSKDTLSSKKKQKSTLPSVGDVKGESKELKMPLEQITGK